MTRKVIITGGAGILGAAVAQAFLAAGHQVAVVDHAPAPAAATDGLVHIGGVDLTDGAQAQSAFDQAKASLGGADVLVNVAGGFRWQTVADGDPAVWEKLFAVNARTCLNMCRAGVTGLSDGGAIVNVGAAAAEKAGAGMGAYAASKAAVARLTESLAVELGGRIRVNAVLPLVMDTPQNRADMPDVDPKAWTATAAVADAIVFLASRAARAINGALVPVTAPTPD
ncbi:SDR family NAD(P)-dependent oxidoreductase [Nitrospirillum iridis]|uniref:NAD(P)-dependent dehydrogenase (Short-subunit alcohol dehydrogenase family) n=1 Tax=Nitrospirillum iridis TaxID=765888 RepID=A0A7X0ECR7_9PROT|nr:SDR family NAD(P)-dependent oxidoreductase [Nitrospirillum iridis]MBB6251953.1 NAD(P)-dependent dehydrogenase (short-subunit alcohol dehydrogenase family) [Nitrospirillum iridis]